MIIVSGVLYVSEADRDSYVRDCRQVIVSARESEGCVDFHLSPDPIEPDRINVYEQWQSVEAVEALRGSGPSSAGSCTACLAAGGGDRTNQSPVRACGNAVEGKRVERRPGPPEPV